jgi:hypothetical protein
VKAPSHASIHAAMAPHSFLDCLLLDEPSGLRHGIPLRLVDLALDHDLDGQCLMWDL